jgi:Glycosyl hydrolase family 53
VPKLGAVSRASLIAFASAVLLAVGLGAATSTAVAAKHSAAAPRTTPVPQRFVGIDVDQPTWPDPFINLGQQLSVMVASGVETIRVVFDWSEIQPYKRWSEVPSADRDEYVNVGGIPTNFTTLDQLVELASQRGLTILPTLLNSPSWDGQKYKGGIVLLPRTDGPFAAFAKALVERYGPHGTFWKTYSGGPKEPIEEWQIWNESNIPAFWPQQPYYSRYLALLRAAHNAIKSADPQAKIVLAGLPNYSWLEMERIYSHKGASKLFDVVAVHPYTKTPQGVITILSYVRQVMNQNGDAAKPMIADEISWPSALGHTSHDTGYDFETTEKGQAKNIGEVLPMLVKDRFKLGLAGFYYYDWAGLDRNNYLAFDFSGLFKLADGGFIAKPAYPVFKRAALTMEGCRSKGSLATDCVK